MVSLVNLPFVVLDRIIGYLDRDDVENCRQLNRFLRRFIDANRHHYPLPPVTITIESEKFFRKSISITKTMVWTGARRNIVLSEVNGMSVLEHMWQAMLQAAQLQEQQELEDEEQGQEEKPVNGGEGEEEEEEMDLIERFLWDEDCRTRLHSVPSILGFSLNSNSSFQDLETTAQLFTKLFERYFISVLEIDEVGSEILTGIANSSKKQRQTVERFDLGLQNGQKIEDVLKLIEFLQPHNLKIGNIDAKDISKVLLLPTVAECFRLDFDLDTDELSADAPAETYLGLKCERLSLPITTKLDSFTLNLILKEWVEGKRNFTSDEAWELFGENNFSPDVVFEGIMCQKFTARSPRASLPPATYYRLSRSHEIVTVFVKGTALLINHPVEYMLSIGSVFI